MDTVGVFITLLGGGDLKKKITLLKAAFLISILLISSLFIFYFYGKDNVADYTTLSSTSNENLQLSGRPTIKFRYDPSYVKEVPFTDQLLDDVIKMSVQWFPSIENSKKPKVYLLTEQSKLYDSYFEDSKISGSYLTDSNRIYMNMESEDDLSLVFIHEYGHYVLIQSFKNNDIDYNLLPDWFHEAVASLFVWDVMNLLPNNIVHFQATKFDQLKNENLPQLYAQGFYAVVDLRNNIGEDFLIKITKGLQEGHSFEEVLANFHVNLDTYHQQFVTNEETITNLDRLFIENPQEYITQVQNLEESLAYPNQYSASTSYSMMQAYESLGDLDHAYLYAKKAAQFSSSPLNLIQIYNVLVDFDEDEAEAVLNRAYELAEQEGYDLEAIKQYIE